MNRAAAKAEFARIPPKMGLQAARHRMNIYLQSLNGARDESRHPKNIEF